MMVEAEPLLKIEGLALAFGERPVLDIAHWRVARGAHGLIKGPSGSGKSTLLHAIAGLIRPKAGSIAIEGRETAGLPGRALDRLRGERIGLVLQNLHLIGALDLVGNLRLAQTLAGKTPDGARIKGLLAKVGLIELARRKPAALSHGERQRAAIVRAVVNRPTLVLADEPTSALDDRNAEAVLRLLIEQADAAGATLLVATHDARLEASLPIRLTLGGCA